MPFTVTHDRPKIKATVNVRFAGLLLLKPNGTKTCDIGINRQTGHSFQVMLIVDKPYLPLTLLRLTSGPLTKDLKITNSSSTAAFKVYAMDNHPFDPTKPDNDPIDHRWALNMAESHPGADFNNGARPMVQLNDGVLYTANRSREGLDPELIIPNQPPKPLMHVAADRAASFDLTCSDTVTIEWEEPGEPKSFQIPRIATVDPVGSTYTIVILNNPPVTNPSPHDELELYYRVLTQGGNPIDPPHRRQLRYKNPAKSDEIPCLSVILNP